MPPTRCLLLSMLLMLPRLAAAGAPSRDDVPLLLQRALDELLGGRQAYEAYLYPPDPRDAAGYFPLLELVIEDARILGYAVSSLHLKLRSVQLDLDHLAQGELRFERARVELLDLKLTGRDLNDALAKVSTGGKVRGLRVGLGDDVITVSGKVKVGFLEPEAQLTAGLDLGDDGRQLLLVPDKLTIAGFPATRSMMDQLLSKLNPLLDLDRLARKQNITVRLRRVRLRPGSLRIEG